MGQDHATEPETRAFRSDCPAPTRARGAPAHGDRLAGPGQELAPERGVGVGPAWPPRPTRLAAPSAPTAPSPRGLPHRSGVPGRPCPAVRGVKAASSTHTGHAGRVLFSRKKIFFPVVLFLFFVFFVFFVFFLQTLGPAGASLRRGAQGSAPARRSARGAGGSTMDPGGSVWGHDQRRERGSGRHPKNKPTRAEEGAGRRPGGRTAFGAAAARPPPPHTVDTSVPLPL